MARWRWIVGKNCIKEVVRAKPNQLLEVYTTTPSSSLGKEIQELGIPLFPISKEKLTRLVQMDAHQCIAAKRRIELLPPFKEWLVALSPPSLVVLCDSLSDPHNLGAILRASECFGVKGVVYSKNRSVPVTPAVSKVSVGASELLPIFSVANLSEAARTLKKTGFSLITAERKPTSHSLFSWKFEKNTALILGAEEKGIQMQLSKLADGHVEIPLFGQIESLNVSQAAAIFLAKFCEQFLQS